MIGKVCRVHQEYAPDGICRWCEPKRLPSLTNMEKDDPEFWATIREIEAANPSSESPIEKRLEAAHVAAAQVEMHRQILESQARLGQGLGFWAGTTFSNSQIKDNKP